jgi:hypothetical protein
LLTEIFASSKVRRIAMAEEQKSKWGSPADWAIGIGGLVTVVGLLRLISGVWTPTVEMEPGVLVASTNNTTVAAITIAVGIVIIIVGVVLRGRK